MQRLTTQCPLPKSECIYVFLLFYYWVFFGFISAQIKQKLEALGCQHSWNPRVSRYFISVSCKQALPKNGDSQDYTPRSRKTTPHAKVEGSGDFVVVVDKKFCKQALPKMEIAKTIHLDLARQPLMQKWKVLVI